MNYGDHNFIEITQQTKLRVALVVSSQSRSTCRASRVEPCCSTKSTAKMNGLDTSNVSSRDVTSQVEFGLDVAEALRDVRGWPTTPFP